MFSSDDYWKWIRYTRIPELGLKRYDIDILHPDCPNVHLYGEIIESTSDYILAARDSFMVRCVIPGGSLFPFAVFSGRQR